jgi:GLPGLI family protein
MFSVSGQILEAQYIQRFQNSSVNLEKVYTFYADNEHSIYYENFDPSKRQNSQPSNSSKQLEKGRTILLSTGEKQTPNIYINQNQEKFLFVETFYGEPVLIEESPAVFKNWTLTDSIKTVGSFKCKLAMRDFRGRSYFAWYAPKISTNFTPWKFGSLPGLVVEAYDETKEFHLLLQKVEIDNKADILDPDKIKDEVDSIKPSYSFKEFEEFLNSKERQMLARIASMLPKGAKPPKIDKNCNDCGNKLENYTIE